MGSGCFVNVSDLRAPVDLAYKENGDEVHTLINAIDASLESVVPGTLTTKSAKFAGLDSKRQIGGGTKSIGMSSSCFSSLAKLLILTFFQFGCGGYQLPVDHTNAVNGNIDAQCSGVA